MQKVIFVFSFFLLATQFFAQNNSLQFDGDNDYVSISGLYLSGYSAITIESWVYLETFNGDGDARITNLVVGGNESVVLRIGDADIDNDKPQFVLDIGGTHYKLDAISRLNANEWYHLAGTYDGVTMKLFINGVLDNSRSQSGTIRATSENTILGGSSSPDRLLDGYLDETKIWNVARTEADIRQNMYRELPTPSSETNLIAYYKFNESSGTTASDSKADFDGTLTGGDWQTSTAMYGPKKCFNFDGTASTSSPDYAYKNSNVTSVTDNFTMMAWIKADDVVDHEGWHCVAYNGDDAGGYGIGIGGSKLVGLFGAVAWLVTDQVLTTDTWYHIAMRRSSGTTRFFLNGVLLSYTSTATPNSPSANFTIANMFKTDHTSIYTNSFDGLIDEVKVFDAALTDQQILDYATQSFNGNENNLVAYYNFDNTQGTTLQSFDGATTNDLTLVNTSDEDWKVSYAMVLAEDATSISKTGFTANWNSPGTNSSYDDGYTIQYSTTSDFSSDNSTVTALSSETSKSVEGLAARTTYYYRVSGKRTGSETIEYSNVKSVTTRPLVTSNADDGGVNTLCYIMANCDDGDSITFNLSAGNETIILGSQIEFNVGKSITIDGANSLGSNTPVTIQVTTPGTSNYRVFYLSVTLNKTISLKNMTLKGGYIYPGGGTLYIANAKTATLDNLTISDSKSETYGGGITVSNAPTFINDCTINNCSVINTSYEGGGGISYAATYQLTITNSTFTGCSSSGHGGGVFTSSPNCSLIDVIISSCSSSENGGGIFCNYGEISLINTIITENLAKYGGGICITYIALSCDNCEISNNTASSDGGGVYIKPDVETINSSFNNTTINNNSSANKGGGLFAFAEDFDDGFYLNKTRANVSVNNCTISGNNSGDLGSGIYCSDDNSSTTNIYLTNNIITYNYKANTYEDVYNNNATLYGNYNIIGNFNLVGGSQNTNYGYTDGYGSNLFANYTEIVPNAIYKPDAAVNGGANKTVALSNESIAKITGVKTGKYEDNGTKFVFYNGSNWVKVEDGSTTVSSGVTTITQDQRGTDRNSLTPSIGAYDNSNAPVPVELVSFSAIFKDNKINLSWQTAIEINNYGFEIEKAIDLSNMNDNIIWEKIGFVEGHGNSNSPKLYTFIDQLPNFGKYLYRLKQIDIDGKFRYSEMVEIEIEEELPTEYALYQNYPNPFNPTSSIEYSIMNSEYVSLKVYDILGKEVVTLVDEKKEAGKYKVNFNAINLTSGLYIYRIQAGKFSQVRKMMLIK